MKVVKCPQVHWVASLKNGADQELITQSITFIGQFLWYSTVTDDNFNSNVLSHKSGGLCGYFKKGPNNIILPINFRLMKHERFTKHIISLWFKQLHGQSRVSHHFFPIKYCRCWRLDSFMGLTSLIFNQTSSVWQAVRVCKREYPGKFCSPSRGSLTRSQSCSGLLHWCIKQDDDLKLRSRSPESFYVCPFAHSYFINELFAKSS